MAVVFTFSIIDSFVVRQLLVTVAHKEPLFLPSTGEIKFLATFPITKDCNASNDVVLDPWRSDGDVKDASNLVSWLDPDR